MLEALVRVGIGCGTVRGGIRVERVGRDGLGKMEVSHPRERA
jgi:hypothetical protein